MTKKDIIKPYEYDNKWWLECSSCGTPTLVSDTKVAKVKCSRCVQIAVINLMTDEEREKILGIKKKPKLAGWHFMKEFVDEDGNVYHKGKEQPDLKGTLKPTKIKPAQKKKAKAKPKKKAIENMSEQELLKLAKIHKDKQKARKK